MASARCQPVVLEKATSVTRTAHLAAPAAIGVRNAAAKPKQCRECKTARTSKWYCHKIDTQARTCDKCYRFFLVNGYYRQPQDEQQLDEPAEWACAAGLEAAHSDDGAVCPRGNGAEAVQAPLTVLTRSAAAGAAAGQLAAAEEVPSVTAATAGEAVLKRKREPADSCPTLPTSFGSTEAPRVYSRKARRCSECPATTSSQWLRHKTDGEQHTCDTCYRYFMYHGHYRQRVRDGVAAGKAASSAGHGVEVRSVGTQATEEAACRPASPLVEAAAANTSSKPQQRADNCSDGLSLAGPERQSSCQEQKSLPGPRDSQVAVQSERDGLMQGRSDASGTGGPAGADAALTATDGDGGTGAATGTECNNEGCQGSHCCPRDSGCVNTARCLAGDSDRCGPDQAAVGGSVVTTDLAGGVMGASGSHGPTQMNNAGSVGTAATGAAGSATGAGSSCGPDQISSVVGSSSSGSGQRAELLLTYIQRTGHLKGGAAIMTAFPEQYRSWGGPGLLYTRGPPGQPVSGPLLAHPVQVQRDHLGEQLVVPESLARLLGMQACDRLRVTVEAGKAIVEKISR